MPIVIRHDEDLVGRIPGLAEKAGKGTRLQREAALDIAYRQDARASEQQAFAQQQALDAAQLQRDVAMIDTDYKLNQQALDKRTSDFDRQLKIQRENRLVHDSVSRLEADSEKLDQQMEIAQMQIAASEKRAKMGVKGREEVAGMRAANTQLQDSIKEQNKNYRDMADEQKNVQAKRTYLQSLINSGVTSGVISRLTPLVNDRTVTMAQVQAAFSQSGAIDKLAGRTMPKLSKVVATLTKARIDLDKARDIDLDGPDDPFKRGKLLNREAEQMIRSAILLEYPDLDPTLVPEAVQMVAAGMGLRTSLDDRAAPPLEGASMSSPEYQDILGGGLVEEIRALARDKGLNNEEAKEFVRDYLISKGWVD